MIKYIAEIGWNFVGELDLAKEMIQHANKSGANVIKFQYWNPKRLKSGAWDEDGRREIYEKAYLDKSKILELKAEVESLGSDFLISVFSKKDAVYINDLGIEAIKVPSHESHNIDLIEYCCKSFKDIYLSVGACTEDELKKVLDVTELYESNIVLMHCVSSYPLNNENANLKRISYLKLLTKHKVGYSDHTESLIAPCAALALGASAIEKHFTTDNNLPGRDNKFALNSENFLKMISNCKETEQLLKWKGVSYQDIETDIVQNYRGRWDN